MTDDPGHESASELIKDAKTILTGHTASDDGFCAGCLAQWARLNLHPCPQARWAAAVIDSYDAGR